MCVFVLNDSLVNCHFVGVITLSCNYEAGHAVRDAGASCEEGDAHYDIWDPECEAYHRYLTERQTQTITTYILAVMCVLFT